MKIVELKVENFKRVIAVEITPYGNTILIKGKNGQGKSSILDAIMAAICGSKAIPPRPLREGTHPGYSRGCRSSRPVM